VAVGPVLRQESLVTILFTVRLNRAAVRYWRHVPRVGDHVMIEGDQGPVTGIVNRVTWLDRQEESGPDVLVEVGG
jgi:hypothetical protein